MVTRLTDFKLKAMDEPIHIAYRNHIGNNVGWFDETRHIEAYTVTSEFLTIWLTEIESKSTYTVSYPMSNIEYIMQRTDPS